MLDVAGDLFVLFGFPLLLWRVRQLERAVYRITFNDIPHLSTALAKIQGELKNANRPRQ